MLQVIVIDDYYSLANIQDYQKLLEDGERALRKQFYETQYNKEMERITVDNVLY